MAFNYEINQLELMQARIKNVPHGWQFTYVGKAFSIRNNLRKPISEEERSMSPGNYPYYGPTKIQGYIGTYEQDGSYALIGEDGDVLPANGAGYARMGKGKKTPGRDGGDAVG